MKILTLSNCPLVESQGSGYVITRYCQGLRALGHGVDVFPPDAYELWQHWRGRANSYRQAVGMVPFALRRLAKNRYDIVEFYGGEAWLTAWILRQLPRRPLLVAHSNGIEPFVTATMQQAARAGIVADPLGKWYQFDQSALFRLAFTQVDGIVTVSECERDYALHQRYQSSDRIVAIDNPLPDEYLNLALELDRAPIVGYCGSWIPRKGVQLLQTDMTRLLTEHTPVRLLLIGVGEGFATKDYFPPHIQDQITVIPHVSDRAELRRLYQTISVLVVPSVYESFGLTIAEAMACGCAVVASKTGFAAGLTHRQHAMVLDSLQPPSLYHAVSELLFQDNLRRTIAQAGYQRVQCLRWQPATQRLAQTYLNWLAARPTAPSSLSVQGTHTPR